MDDSTPSPDSTPPTSRRPSRRTVLATGAVVVLAAAGGTGAGLLPDRVPRTPAPNPAPRDLLAAAQRERVLIADLDATTGGAPALRKVLLRARADHAAHLAGFERLLAAYDPSTSSSGQTSSPAPPGIALPSGAIAPSDGAMPSSSAPPRAHGSPRTAAQLRTAEFRAAAKAAHAAAANSGALAVLLASVSASESCHAALIT